MRLALQRRNQIARSPAYRKRRYFRVLKTWRYARLNAGLRDIRGGHACYVPNKKNAVRTSLSCAFKFLKAGKSRSVQGSKKDGPPSSRACHRLSKEIGTKQKINWWDGSAVQRNSRHIRENKEERTLKTRLNSMLARSLHMRTWTVIVYPLNCAKNFYRTVSTRSCFITSVRKCAVKQSKTPFCTPSPPSKRVPVKKTQWKGWK